MNIVQKVTLFLGAGASSPFGYPTTQFFIEGLRAELANSPSSLQLLNDILNIDGIKDAEHVIELLDLLHGINKHPTADFFKRYVTAINFPKGQMQMSEMLEIARILRDRIQDDVFRQYQFNPNTVYGISSAYLPLIISLYKASGNEEELPIFTTNYDRVIEEFCYRNHFVLKDGFKRNGIIEESEFDSKEYNFENSKSLKSDDKPIIKLYKLHGSLNWRTNSDNKTVRIGTEERTRHQQTHEQFSHLSRRKTQA